MPELTVPVSLRVHLAHAVVPAVADEVGVAVLHIKGRRWPRPMFAQQMVAEPPRRGEGWPKDAPVRLPGPSVMPLTPSSDPG